MFTHLHVHTEYSLLDVHNLSAELPAVFHLQGRQKGRSDPRDTFQVYSLAITDHGNMYGAVDFYKACKNHGIRPVIGCEVVHQCRDPVFQENNCFRRKHHGTIKQFAGNEGTVFGCSRSC